jgi:hypothetical protein
VYAQSFERVNARLPVLLNMAAKVIGIKSNRVAIIAQNESHMIFKVLTKGLRI